MFNSDIMKYVSILSIPNFRGVLMRDELPIKPNEIECGILNLNTHKQLGSHWVCWYKDGTERYYFDSFGEPPPLELLHYLKTSTEINLDLPAIRRSSITVQRYGSNECGSLCLYVLKMLNSIFYGIIETCQKISSITNFLSDYKTVSAAINSSFTSCLRTRRLKGND